MGEPHGAGRVSTRDREPLCLVHRGHGRAGIAELLKPGPGHRAPYFAPKLEAATAAPRLYIVASRCPELAEQLENAPLLRLDSARKGAGEIVDPGWESRSGHCVAALR